MKVIKKLLLGIISFPFLPLIALGMVCYLLGDAILGATKT